MMRQLKPWTYGPFELLQHAEMHYLSGEDLDRRIAMIGFDNAIEVAITTYLSLNPLQRANRTYTKADIGEWTVNYHTKLEFFFHECAVRSVTTVAERADIVWFHEVRNEQYHMGGGTVPQRRELDGVRAAALEVFSILFDETDASALLDEYISARNSSPAPPRTDTHDRLIDDEHDMIDVCGRVEYASDVLYSLDPERYRDVALALENDANVPSEEWSDS